jgi:putative Mg2+ transporter-C (MgtC) family protein
MSLDQLLAWLGQNTEGTALVRIVIAGLLGAAIGWEREWEGKPAGVRTYAAVAIGAATFTGVGIVVYGPSDPTARLVAQIITGIGFLGAGTILRMQMRVIGLTTAAGMWVSAGIGIAIGYGLYVIGIGTTLAMLVMLRLLDPEHLFPGRRRPRHDEEADL